MIANGPLVGVFGWYDNEWGLAAGSSTRREDRQTMPAAVAA
jgi:hypothetical protein